MSFYNKSKELREEGKLGKNKGIPIKWERFKKFIPNIQAKYFLSASDSGVGKTKLGNYLFMYNTFFQWVDGKIEDFEVNYYSCEMTTEEIIIEFQALYLWEKYKILTDYPQINSEGDNKIPRRVDELLNSKELEDITNLFESKVHIVSERVSSKFLYKEIQRIAKANGTIEYKKINGQDVFKSYTKHNPEKWIIIIFDNFQKLTLNEGQDLRKAIVETSLFLDMGRFHFGFVICAMQQINRTSKTFDRYKLEQYFPSEQDLKDSEAPFHDCQICIVQISPFKLDLPKLDGYPVKGKNGLEDRLRAIKIIKNRGGIPYKVDYFLFLGENSFYSEIPYPEKMTEKDYEKINNLTKIIE